MAAKKIKEVDYILTWLLYTVATLISGFIAGLFAGGIVGFFLGMLGAKGALIQFFAGWAGFFAGLPFSYLFFRIFVAYFIVKKLETPADAAQE